MKIKTYHFIIKNTELALCDVIFGIYINKKKTLGFYSINIVNFAQLLKMFLLKEQIGDFTLSNLNYAMKHLALKHTIYTGID